MDVGASIKKLRESHDMTQEQLGVVAGVSSMAVSQWENGRAVPRMGSIQRMSDYFGIPKSTIMGDAAESSPSAFIAVPLHGRVAAGIPIEMLEVDDMSEAPSRYVDDDPQAFMVRVVGDSMNHHIHDGEYALVSPKYTEPNDRDMFLVTVNGYDATIKHVRRLANGVELLPDSYDPTYRPQVYDFNEIDTPEIKILGKVVWWCKEF